MYLSIIRKRWYKGITKISQQTLIFDLILLPFWVFPWELLLAKKSCRRKNKKSYSCSNNERQLRVRGIRQQLLRMQWVINYNFNYYTFRPAAVGCEWADLQIWLLFLFFLWPWKMRPRYYMQATQTKKKEKGKKGVGGEKYIEEQQTLQKKKAKYFH